MNMEPTTQLILVSVVTVVNLILFLVFFGMAVGILWGIKKITMSNERIEDVMEWSRHHIGKDK